MTRRQSPQQREIDTSGLKHNGLLMLVKRFRCLNIMTSALLVRSAANHNPHTMSRQVIGALYDAQTE